MDSVREEGKNYFLERCRNDVKTIVAEHEAVIHILRTGRQHKRHEEKHPDRMGTLLENAKRHLSEAEHMVESLLAGLVDTPLQKIAFIGFQNTLSLAHQYHVLAVIDPATVLGEGVRADRVKGANALNEKKAKNDKVGHLIKLLARRTDGAGDDVRPGKLWPELETLMANSRLYPREKGTGVKKSFVYEGVDPDEEITYRAFSKRIARERI